MELEFPGFQSNKGIDRTSHCVDGGTTDLERQVDICASALTLGWKHISTPFSIQELISLLLHFFLMASNSF